MTANQGWLPRWPEYLPDRYDRLAGGAAEIASVPAFFDPNFVTADMLREFAAKIAADRMLDGLTDRDADTVIAIVVITFPAGIPRMVRASCEQLWSLGVGHRPEDDKKAVASALVQIVALAQQMVERL